MYSMFIPTFVYSLRARVCACKRVSASASEHAGECMNVHECIGVCATVSVRVCMCVYECVHSFASSDMKCIEILILQKRHIRKKSNPQLFRVENIENYESKLTKR